jgi:hypothetical protein
VLAVVSAPRGRVNYLIQARIITTGGVIVSGGGREKYNTVTCEKNGHGLIQQLLIAQAFARGLFCIRRANQPGGGGTRGMMDEALCRQAVL